MGCINQDTEINLDIGTASENPLINIDLGYNAKVSQFLFFSDSRYIGIRVYVGDVAAT